MEWGAKILKKIHLLFLIKIHCKFYILSSPPRGKKKLYELTFKIENVLIFLKIEVAANVISNMRIIL